MFNKLQLFLESMPIDWLLRDESFVKYRVLIDLLGREEGAHEVVAAEQLLYECAPIKQIFERQNKEGYWGTPKDIFAWWPKKDTTFWILGVLGDFGLQKKFAKVAGACEYVFSTQLPSGGFGWVSPPTPGDCFTGILTEALAKLGYIGDRRLDQAYAWLIPRQRLDGGFWCKNTGLPSNPREREPSCAFATLCILGALSQNPELKNSPTAQRSAEFLLECWDNRGKIKYAGHDSRIGKGWEELKYPFSDYRILKYLDILSQFEFVRKDRRIAAMMELLISKRDASGSFYAGSIHKAWSAFDFGQKQEPSRWISLLAYRIAKRIASN